MKPSYAIYALNYKITLLIILLTNRARGLGSAGSALSVVFLPARFNSRIIRAAGLALSAPFALPGSLRYFTQRRDYTIGMVANIALVAQNQEMIVVLLTATLGRKYSMINKHRESQEFCLKNTQRKPIITINTELITRNRNFETWHFVPINLLTVKFYTNFYIQISIRCFRKH